MLENILKACQYVADNATYVKISHKKTKKTISRVRIVF